MHSVFKASLGYIMPSCLECHNNNEPAVPPQCAAQWVQLGFALLDLVHTCLLPHCISVVDMAAESLSIRHINHSSSSSSSGLFTFTCACWFLHEFIRNVYTGVCGGLRCQFPGTEITDGCELPDPGLCKISVCS